MSYDKHVDMYSYLEYSRAKLVKKTSKTLLEIGGGKTKRSIGKKPPTC